MWHQVAIIFIIFHCISAQDASTMILDANINYDALIDDIQQRLDAVQTRIDSMNTTMLRQLTIQQNETENELKDFKATFSTGIKRYKRETRSCTSKPPTCATLTELCDNLLYVNESFNPNCICPPSNETTTSTTANTLLTTVSVNGTTTRPMTTSRRTTVSSTTDVETGETDGWTTATPNPGELFPKDCEEAMGETGQNGIYTIQFGYAILEVLCEKNPPDEDMCVPTVFEPSPWLYIQRRQNGQENFYRDWNDYKYGFGKLGGEFFIGLQNIYQATKHGTYELWIKLVDFEGEIRCARYNNFEIGHENDGFPLISVGNYTGNAGDALCEHHVCNKWTTRDRDNDRNEKCNCAIEYTGAWWYSDCHHSNLNGRYYRRIDYAADYGKGIHWCQWHGYEYSLKYVHMAIRKLK